MVVDGENAIELVGAGATGVEGGETPPADAPADAPQDDLGEVVITIGEEAPPEDEQPAPQWVKDLRKTDREKTKRIRELEQREAERERQQSSTPAAEMVKPTLAGCDYDEAEFETKLEAWHQQRRQADEEKRKKADAEKAERDAWQARVDAHNKAKAELKVADYDDAEEAAKLALSVTQQSIIVSGSENSAMVVYALGKNPAKVKELAAIKDPVKFAFAVAKLETQLKVMPRKAPPPPETPLRGDAPGVAGSSDKKLDQLREEASRTGDMSKVIAYKAQLKQKSK